MDSLLIGISFLTLTTICYWYYKKFIAPYSKFPSYSLTFQIIYWILTNKCPRHISFTSFIFQKLASECKKYESEGFCLVWLVRPCLFVFGEESVKTLSYEPEAIYKPSLGKIFSEAIGLGLVTRDGDTWKSSRKMFEPFFRLKVLKGKMDIYNKHSTFLVARLAEVTDESSIDMADFLPFCLIRIIFESMTGLNSEEYNLDIKNFYESIEKLSAFTTYRIVHPYMHWKWTLKLFPMGRQYLKFYEDSDDFTRKILMQVKNSLLETQATDKLDEEYLESENSSCHVSKSLAQELIKIHLKDPTFTMQNVLEEFKNFLAAGYDTLNYTLMWCIFMLGVHQDVQEQLFNEVEDLSHKDVTYDDLSLLVYLDCFIKETLRLYPTVPIYARRLNKDKKCGKYNIPNGTDIVFFPYLYHRNSELYPDPERFDLDRFRKGTSYIRSWAHIPFAEGVRNCIGKNFALMELKVILVHIIRKFKITSLDRREDVVLDWAIVLKSVEPLRIKLSFR